MDREIGMADSFAAYTDAPDHVPEAAESPACTYDLILGDAFTWLSDRRAESIHAIVTDPPYGLKEYTETEKAKTIEGSPLELSDETSLESDREEERTVVLTLPEGTKGAQEERNVPGVEDFSEQLKELSSVTVTDVSDNEIETDILLEQVEEAEIEVRADSARYLPGDMDDIENKFVKRASRSPLGRGRTRSLVERFSGTHSIKQASAVGSPPTVGKALKEMDVEVPSTSEIDTFVNEAHAEISVAVAELDAPQADLDALVRNATSGLDSIAAELAATLEGVKLDGKAVRDDLNPSSTASSRRAQTGSSVIAP